MLTGEGLGDQGTYDGSQEVDLASRMGNIVNSQMPPKSPQKIDQLNPLRKLITLTSSVGIVDRLIW